MMQALIMACLLFIFTSGFSAFRSSAQEPAAAPPSVITVGSYIQNITDMNLRTNKIGVDFYVWFRWLGDEFEPHKSFELTNGEVLERTVIDVRMIGDINYSQVRVRALLNVPWNLRKFSLDRQAIPIIIEDAKFDTFRMVYAPDRPNISMRESIVLPGYVFSRQHGHVDKTTYSSNFGDIELPTDAKSVYSRYVHQIEIARNGYQYFFKLFATMFLSTFTVAVAFLMARNNFYGRVGLCVGALFAVVATNYVIANQLPDSDQITLADLINFYSMAVVVISLTLVVYSWRLSLNGGSERAAVAIDRIGLIGVPVIYIGLVAIAALL